MDFKSYIFTLEKTKCTGCGSCFQTCPHSALSMQPDKEGFLYPLLDKEKCIQCGACEKSCPVVHNNSNGKENQKFFIATTVEELYYKDSASIGICTMLSDKIAGMGGKVYGAYLDENNWTTYHIGVQDKEGVQKIRNSKYLQSDTKKTFTDVRNTLKVGTTVLYIGTPCQIAGLKSFLKKDYPNLYTIDIMCHGVFSPKLMKYEVGYWERMFHGRIMNFKFRSKRIYKRSNGGMVNFDYMKGASLKHIERFAGSSPSYRCYAYSEDGVSYNLRPSCYSCSFRDQGRYGDICVGDPWKVDDTVLSNQKLRGANPIRSLFMTNTVKGNELFEIIKQYLTFEEIDRCEVFKQDALLSANNDIPAKRKELYDRLDVEEYGALVERLLGCNLEHSHKSFVYSYYYSQIKERVKKLLRR